MLGPFMFSSLCCTAAVLWGGADTNKGSGRAPLEASAQIQLWKFYLEMTGFSSYSTH